MLNGHHARKYLLSALALLATILAVSYFIGWDHAGPQIEIRGYDVVLSEPNSRSFANVFIENIGGDGTITVYSSAAFALPTSDAREIRKQLESNTDVLIAKDLGGVEFALGAQEQRSFTVNGPLPTPEQAESLNRGELYFYFSGTIIVDGEEPEKTFCSYVVGNKPDVLIQCPEN